MKKKRVKRIRFPILMILLLVLATTPFGVAYAAGDVPPPSQEFYIYDEANLINQQVAQYIIATNESLHEQTGAQVVIAVINSLQGASLEEYGNELYRNWGIGSPSKNNGILLLVALEERLIRIEVGYGLEGAIPDGRAGEIRDEWILPNFQKGQYNQGLLRGFQEIIHILQEEYQVNITPQQSPNFEHQEEFPGADQGQGTVQKIMIIVGILIFLFIDFRFFGGLITFSLFRGGSRGGFGGGYPGGGRNRGGGRNSGGGGSSGGGGASGGW